MQHSDIVELQKSILSYAFNSTIGFEQFKSMQHLIDTKLFGAYTKLADIVKQANSTSDLELSKISTDIIAQGLAKQFCEITECSFEFPKLYRDIKILLTESSDKWFEGIIELQLIFKSIDEAKTKWMSKGYVIRDLYDSAIEELVQKSDRKKLWKTIGYATGFPLLDRFTEGIQKGTVTRLNAYSNVGKSKFSYQICNSLLDQWAHVLYFSLEVQRNMVIYQLIANKYKKPIGDVYRMQFDDIDFTDLFMKKLEIIDDKYSLSEILQYAELRKPDAIFIDFVQNIQSEGKSEYERMTNIAVAIQQLAIKHNIAIFDLSQISNSGTNYVQGDAVPSKWSGALVASCDIGLVMKKDKLRDNTVIIHIAKNKFGYNGKSIDYSADFSKWVFSEIGESKSDAF